MDWYYARNGQQQGPVTDEEFAGLVNSNVITEDTLVWHAGLANWQPYKLVQAGAAASPAPAPPSSAETAAAAAAGGMVCCECGRVFPPDQVVRHGDRYVCAACKPVFLQRLAEGAAFAPLGAVTEDQLTQRDYDSPIADCISRGWQTYRACLGPILGTTVLMGLIMLVVNGIPYLSYILALVFNGAIMGGFWTYFIKHVRQQPAFLADAFSGFSSQFGQLLLGNLVVGILTGIPVIPGAIVMVIGVVMASTGGGGSTVMVVAIGIGGVLLLAGILVSVYLSTLWVFTIPVVADKKLTFWPAMQLSRKMVAKHWWSNFGLMLVAGLITSLPFAVILGIGIAIGAVTQFSAAGIVAIVVGSVLGLLWLLGSAPVAMSAFATRYNDIFHDLTPRA
ncbi:MAG: DUF4339 domain-containing protein [Verrucomicrobia bacterium]|nr:DUF4339 domain-containing protein [Verrucomicrobiota bacterium]